MIYKTFQNTKLSALGLGTMRLPVIGGDDGVIDVPAVEKMVAYAMEHGINYYDTAWGYHNGNSETVIGKALSKYPRVCYHLATKFPGYDQANMPKVGEIFEKQLEKCGVDYFDFYLLHNVNESNVDAYLDPQYGIIDYLLEQKKAGRIRHLGFSAHGAMPVLERFLNAVVQYMEFCQIQLNYIDWTFQNAKAKVELLNKHNIPVWVMEPLRGGKLAKLPAEAAESLRTLRPEEGVPAWGFRFLQTIPGVTMVLSGMSDLEQIKDNVCTFETDSPLNEKEQETLLSVADGMLGGVLPCTACHYCVSHCPQGIGIPRLLDLYNEFVLSAAPFIPAVVMSFPPEKRPSGCVGCRSCEKVCPQQIKISEAMSDFAEKLNA